MLSVRARLCARSIPLGAQAQAESLALVSDWTDAEREYLRREVRGGGGGGYAPWVVRV